MTAVEINDGVYFPGVRLVMSPVDPKQQLEDVCVFRRCQRLSTIPRTS
jgi:hypothetical protein